VANARNHSGGKMRKACFCIMIGCCSLFMETFAFGGDKKVVTSDSTSLLVSASVTGDINVVRDLLEKGADVNGRDAYGNFPLYAAVVGDHADVVELLVRKGANVNQTKAANVLPVLERNTSPLHAASIVGDQSVVGLLVEAGADVNAFADINEESERLVKSMIDNPQLSKFFTPESSARLRAGIREIGITPLTQASRFDHANVVAFLLDHGANVNFQRPGNSTALIEAGMAGSRDVLELLINRKADLNLKGEDRGTALALALFKEQYESARILLAAGADFQMDDNNGAHWKRFFALGAFQFLVAEGLTTKGRKAEAKNAFTDAIASLTAARDDLKKAAEQASKEAGKDEKDAKSAGRWANVVSISDLTIPVLTGFSQNASQRQMQQVVALKNARTPDQYFGNFEALERGAQLGATPATPVSDHNGTGSASSSGVAQSMRESAQTMRDSAQMQLRFSQILSEKETACEDLIRNITSEMATLSGARPTP
jgi:ankyrin repeat protein